MRYRECVMWFVLIVYFISCDAGLVAASPSIAPKWPGWAIPNRIRKKLPIHINLPVRGVESDVPSHTDSENAELSPLDSGIDETEDQDEEVDAVVEKKKKKPPVVVKFTASETLRSPPLPLPSKGAKAIDDFFNSTENCNLLFSASATLEEVPHPTEELVASFWRHSSRRRVEAGLSPVAEDVASTRLIRLANPPMRCIGVTLHSITHVGIQLLKGNKNGRPDERRDFPGYPEIQFTLLDTTFDATGPEPLVRLFYKIMGGHRPNDDSRHDRVPSAIQTLGLTRFTAEPAASDGDGGRGAVVFTSSASMESRLHVPYLLWKVIPMSKARMEKQGSASIQNAIIKDMGPAMERFVDAYLEWISSSSE